MHVHSVPLPRGRVNVFETGEGSPVVLLHGLLGGVAYLAPLARSLARGGRRVLLPELPGHGDSDQLLPFRFADVVDHLAEAVAALGVTRPAVGGHSLGAPLAVEWAARHPVRSLAAISPVGMVPLRIGPLRHLLRVPGAAAWLADRTGPLVYGTPPGRRLVMSWFVGASRADAVPRELVQRMFLAGIPVAASPTLPSVLEELLPFDLGPVARRVDAPALVLWGERDPHWRNAIPLADALHGVSVSLPGVGHMPLQEAPFATRVALEGSL